MVKKTEYAGAVALITGGASGIGRALGQACAERGSEVILADRQQELAESAAEKIRQRDGKARAVALDVRDPEAFEAVAADAVARSGRLDLFFNNAGIAVAGEVDQYRYGDWDDVLDVNVRGVVYGIQAVYPKMIARGRGHIINTASVAGLLPMPGGGSYCLSKHGVVGLSKTLRIEAAHHGVRVSVLCPGAIRTPILTGGKYGRVEHTGLDEAGLMALWEKFRPMDPGLFAEQVLRDVGRNEPYILVPRWYKAFWLLERLAPRLSLRLWGKVHEKRRVMMRPAEGDPRSVRAAGQIRPRSSPARRPGTAG